MRESQFRGKLGACTNLFNRLFRLVLILLNSLMMVLQNLLVEEGGDDDDYSTERDYVN